jgi:hypothetical protein
MVPPLELTATPQARPASTFLQCHILFDALTATKPPGKRLQKLLLRPVEYFLVPLVLLPGARSAATAAVAATLAVFLSRVQTLHHHPDAHAAAGAFIFLRDCQFHWDFHLQEC